MKIYQQYIKKLVSKGGPAPEDYIIFSDIARVIMTKYKSGQISENQLGEIRNAFGNSFSTSTIQGFAFSKPHGYAGDYELIERIYNKYYSPNPEHRNWDVYAQLASAAQAVRNRKEYFCNLLTSFTKAREFTEVLEIASGPGRDMYEWLCQNPEAKIFFECVELDENAINFAKGLNARFKDKIIFHHVNALRFVPAKQYDLIWAAGIFDYFNDKTFIFLLKRLLNSIKNTGEFVIGNFSTNCPERSYMELFDWVLFHRSKEDLIRLALASGCREDQVYVDSEPCGVNLFLHVKG